MFFNTSSDLDIIPCPLLQYQYHHFTMLTFVGFFSNIGWGRCCNSVMICIFIIQQNNFILHSFNRWWVGLSWHSTSAYEIIENLVRSLQWYWWSSASYLWLFNLSLILHGCNNTAFFISISSVLPLSLKLKTLLFTAEVLTILYPLNLSGDFVVWL